MTASGYSSADLLTRFNRWAGRPTVDAMTDAQKYAFLADGQDAVFMEVANVAQNSLIGAPTLMTTADGGYTFTFGTDGNGYPLFPLGKAEIYSALAAIPNYPWRPGLDYLDEGVQIRIPNNLQWSGTLYWRGMTAPQAISSTVQPVLQPPPARILIVIKAVQQFADEFVRNPALADRMEIRWEREWGKYATAIRKHFRGAYPLGPLTSGGPFGGLAGSFGFGWGG